MLKNLAFVCGVVTIAAAAFSTSAQAQRHGGARGVYAGGAHVSGARVSGAHVGRYYGGRYYGSRYRVGGYYGRYGYRGYGRYGYRGYGRYGYRYGAGAPYWGWGLAAGAAAGALAAAPSYYNGGYYAYAAAPGSAAPQSNYEGGGSGRFCTVIKDNNGIEHYADYGPCFNQ